MTKVYQNALLVALFLVPPYAALTIAIYWKFFDNAPPVQLMYQHPKFLDEPVGNRDLAKQHELDGIESGGSVWVYREICTTDSRFGTVRGAWVAGSFVWQTPERSIAPRRLGCVSESFNVTAPSSNPTRDFVYEVEWEYDINPLVTVAVDMPSLKLRVYAPGDCPDPKVTACREPK